MEIIVESDSVTHAAHRDDVLSRQPQQVAAVVVPEVWQKTSESIPVKPLHHLVTNKADR
jgi:hypothetical protein